MSFRPTQAEFTQSLVPTVPPPSRTPATAIILADPNNSIKKDLGPEHDLSLGEGTYALRDEILLGVIPPHPTDPVPTNVHVLDPKPGPLTAGVKLSLAVIAPRRTSPRLRQINSGYRRKSLSESTAPSVSSEPSTSSSNDNVSDTRSSSGGSATKPWVLGDDNPALHVLPKNVKDKDRDKKRKPASNMAKSSSSFISRVTPHELPTRRMGEHDPSGIYAFVNTNRAFLWLDLSATDKATNGTTVPPNLLSEPKIDPLCKIFFTRAFALCHDVNKTTLASNHCDVIIGFNFSDFIWWDPPTQKYNRMNKNGAVTSSPPMDVKWVPGSDNLFVAAHRDGSIIVYDKEKEDAPFVPEDETSVQSTRRPRILVRKSIHSKNQKTNPVAYYKTTKEPINNIAFAPTGRHLAAVSEDGTLRIIDLTKEELVDLQQNYYGGITCVCWSPDGLYLLTGGQDDMVSVWSIADQSLVARCIGHKSWISGVAFDEWRCDDEGNYRFASIGEDCRLLFWDFSVGMLSRPRAASTRQSISSFAPSRSQSSTTVQRVGTVNGAATPTQARQNPADMSQFTSQVELRATLDEIVHAVVPRAASAKLLPVMAKTVDAHPLSWIGFGEECVIVACKAGHIRTYDRPAAAAAAEGKAGTHKSNGSTVFSNPFLQ